MEIINNPTAWMVRYDGAAYPVIQHIYGSSENLDEALFAAQWLYEHTNMDRDRQLVSELIITYGRHLSSDTLTGMSNIHEQIRAKPYRFLDYAFALDIMQNSRVTVNQMLDYGASVLEVLNEEFMRVRLGGLYHTVPGNRDVYFRVSSKIIRWDRVIRSFVRQYRTDIDTVTIVWDEESTGKEDFFLDNKGKKWEHRPIGDLLDGEAILGSAALAKWGIDASFLDPEAIPLVEFFNEHGLTTKMSCQGHDDVHRSLFWIEFLPTIYEVNILEFMRNYCVDGLCGRFAQRLIREKDGKSDKAWFYFAASAEAAHTDLLSWKKREGAK